MMWDRINKWWALLADIKTHANTNYQGKAGNGQKNNSTGKKKMTEDDKRTI